MARRNKKTQNNQPHEEKWIVESKPVPGDSRAFDVTFNYNNKQSQVRILAMRLID